MKEMSTDFPTIHGIKHPGQANEDIGDDDQESELVGVGGDNDHHKLEHVHQFVHGVLHGANDASLRLLDRL